ncbi:winged helix-turn-helix domain-containing protein [Budvicia aquatica]|uniref:Transcriptional regulatory protein, C terminal n=1 Tax=Budvicia aquatica TaxID=82979 RepID=A0A2C6DJM2_9GAMM|nr:winged helix-turn-helix domain-containing protein [Budvicia aquatica]PHI28532.1 hypothetical protein CRN84_03890 [Budvicia aquatica]VFS46480.1 Transcriptional regulatory protein, C terminal [Budvicia aquatica]
MYYQINKLIGFNPEDGSLWALSEPGNLVTIPRFASLLLELLIKNNQKSLSRDFFMNELWENKGLVSSNNNLNNYISIIRRTLSSLGLDDIIKTIPRYGFSFDAKTIEIFDSERVELSEPPVELEEEQVIYKKTNSKFLLKIVISIILFWLITIVFIFLKYPQQNTQFNKVMPLGMIENCKVMGIWNGIPNNYNMNKVINGLSSLTESHVIDCKMKSTIYYYESISAKTPSVMERIKFVVQCPEILNNNMECKNFLNNEIIYESH